MNITLIYLIISELTLFYLLMFLIILFLVYLHYMINEVRLELCLCIGSYSAYSLDRWVSGKYWVDVVPRPYLSVITPYSPKHELGHGSESPIESFIYLFLENHIDLIPALLHHVWDDNQA